MSGNFPTDISADFPRRKNRTPHIKNQWTPSGRCVSKCDVADLILPTCSEPGSIREYYPSGGATQRYKELNRARTDFFNGVQFLRKFVPEGKGVVYPASTESVPTESEFGWHQSLSVRCRKSPRGLLWFPLNRGQTSAFDTVKHTVRKARSFPGQWLWFTAKTAASMFRNSEH